LVCFIQSETTFSEWFMPRHPVLCCFVDHILFLTNMQ
jgi:hypothetical protein